MIPSILKIALLLSLTATMAGAQSQLSNTSTEFANNSVSSAAYFLQQVNESGYLIFYPNLTQAYANLAMAQSLYNRSPASAIIYANKAVTEANAEYARISDYRDESMVVMAAFTIVFVLLLARVMRPARAARKRRSK